MILANLLSEWEQAIDPADPDNDLVSNRCEQLAGVPIPKTDRTFNGAKIEFVHTP